MDPVLLQNLPRLVELVRAEDDDRLLADPVDRSVEIEDVDFRLGQRFQDGVHSAGMKRHLGGQNRGDLVIETVAFQNRCRPIRITDHQPHRAAFGCAGGEQGLGRDVLLVEDVRDT